MSLIVTDSHDSCPLCRGDTAVIHADGPRTLRHCRRCDLIHVPAREHLPSHDQKNRYLLHRNSRSDRPYVARLERIIALLRAYAPAAGRVLDYGSGPAPVLVQLLRDAGYEADGYDLFFASDTRLTPPYDAVVSVETFEHFADPAAELRRITSLLDPGGVLIVQTLFHPGPANLSGWWYLRDRTHVSFYSRQTFDWIGGQFGMRIIHCDGRETVILART